MKTTYEWDIETWDGEDIVDHEPAEKLRELDRDMGPDKNLVLVRNEWHKHDGLEDRCWAYVEGGKLPECFSVVGADEEYVCRPNMKVPKRFHQELSRWSA